MSNSGDVELSRDINVTVEGPCNLALGQNYPNAFNPMTTICYQLTNDNKVRLKFYNLLGQEVKTLVDELKQGEYHQEVFDASRHA